LPQPSSRTSGSIGGAEAVSLDHVDGETHVVVTDPDGELVSVSGSEEVFALMALANDALPDGDPRKITREHLLALRAGDAETVRHIADVFDKMLPPT
jgi:hypothetical protein